MERGERSDERSMEELGALAETAGAEVVAELIQTRAAPDPRSFIGDGKVQELKDLIEANSCDLAVFDNELTPSQMRVLSEDLGVRVLDRSGLILDIFAQRARSREGKLQGRTWCARRLRAARRPSGRVGPVKPSWRRTGVTSAGRSGIWKRV